MEWGKTLQRLVDPPVPESVREEYLLQAARRLRAHGVLLFGGIGISCPAIAISLGPELPGQTWFGLQLVVALLAALAAAWLVRQKTAGSDPAKAGQVVRLATRVALALAVTASLWASYCWVTVPASARIYFPLFASLGMMSLAYCVASVRRAAIVTLVVGLLPITLLMLASGTLLDRVAAGGIIAGGFFQLVMLGYQYGNLVELLRLQHTARTLAQTDVLTGLTNRRALLDFATTRGPAAGCMRLLLIDIDEFKPVNDEHGHEMGDEVLREVAAILARRRKPGLCVARMGGEEFALLGAEDVLPEAVALAILAEVRNTAMPHGKQLTISIGVAEGGIADEADWRKLFAQADTALYRAKRGGRNRMERCDSITENAAVKAAKVGRAAA